MNAPLRHALVLAFAALLAVANWTYMRKGPLASERMSVVTSPDGRYQLVAYRRPRLGAFGFGAMPLQWVELSDRRGRVLERAETQDAEHLEVTWSDAEVFVSPGVLFDLPEEHRWGRDR